MKNSNSELQRVQDQENPHQGRPYNRCNFYNDCTQFPQADSADGAVGVGTNGISMQQAIDVEDYKEQRKERLARHLEDNRMYEYLRRERARMIAESDARLLEAALEGC